MKKFGFTLAEVLITLGIIGVIAALTTPALVKNSGTAKIGPSLAKFVNTVETGAEQMMYKEKLRQLGASNLLSLANYIIMTPTDSYEFQGGDGTKKSLAGIVNKYETYMNGVENYSPGYCSDHFEYPESLNCHSIMVGLVMNESSRTLMEQRIENLKNNGAVYQLKDGSIMVIIPAKKDEIHVGAYRGVIAEVIVDIDGKKGTNEVGKDVYGFLLDRTGILIPAGSNAHKTINQSGDYFIKNYKENCSISSADLDENFACTGKIADNGYNAD